MISESWYSMMKLGKEERSSSPLSSYEDTIIRVPVASQEAGLHLELDLWTSKSWASQFPEQ
jgi:hypothetical protein